MVLSFNRTEVQIFVRLPGGSKWVDPKEIIGWERIDNSLNKANIYCRNGLTFQVGIEIVGQDIVDEIIKVLKKSAE